MPTNESQKSNGEVLGHNPKIDKFLNKASDLSNKAVEVSRNAIDKSVTCAKDYPVHTAIAAGVLGFVAGFFTSKVLK